MDLDKIVGEIERRIDIVQVVEKYVKLKKAGRNFLGLCPFHAERTPSFTVSPEKQMFYCFGCRTGGNLVTFISKIEGLSFMEALHKLAEETGVELDSLQKHSNKEPDFDLLENVQEFFKNQFLKYLPASDYLQKRGMPKEMISKFQIGYAPSDANILVKVLQQNRLDLDKAHLLGVLSKGSDNRFFAYMRGRITYPIFDNRNHVVAFGGRTLGNDEPKYLNSPATPLFEKGKGLYAYTLARSTISKLGRAIIVEGYMDVISMHQIGFTETIGVLGTAFTSDQSILLRKLGADVFLFFDSDDAGTKATLAAVKICLASGLSCKVIRQSTGKDPDDLAKYGKDAVTSVIDSALDPIEFAIASISKDENHPNSPQSKSRIAKQVLEIIDLSPDAIVKNQYRDLLSKLLQLPRAIIDSPTVILPKKLLNINSTRATWERRVIRAIITNEEIKNKLLPVLSEDYFSDLLCKRVCILVLENVHSIDTIMRTLSVKELESELTAFIASIGVEDMEDEVEILAEAAWQELSRLKLDKLRKKSQERSLTSIEMQEYLNLQRMLHAGKKRN